jgi:2'-5' RNA ligase
MWWDRILRMAGVEKEEPESHGGVALMLFLDPKMQKSLALSPDDLTSDDSPELPEEIHVTLCYLGKSDIPKLKGRRKELESLMEHWCATEAPIEGTVGGFGCFTAGDGAVLYYSVDAPMLASMRQRLVDFLKEHDFEIDMLHGYNPHITLAYLADKKDAKIFMPNNEKITMDTLTVGWADYNNAFPFKK